MDLCLAVHHPDSRGGQDQFFLRPRKAHVAQAPFLFKVLIVAGIQRSCTREEVLFHAGEIDLGKFQAFRTVHGHEGDAVGPSLHFINVCHQGDLFQKTPERFGIAGFILKACGLVLQFRQVFEAGLRFDLALFLQGFAVAALIEDEVDQFGDAQFLCRFAERPDQFQEGLQFQCRGLSGLRAFRKTLQGVPEGDPLLPCERRNLFDRRIADTAPRDVNDPADRYVIRVPARLLERASAGPAPGKG